MANDRSTSLRPARIGLATRDGFLGVTAVLGGAALLFGWLGIPTDLLVGSPFGSYTIPRSP